MEPWLGGLTLSIQALALVEARPVRVNLARLRIPRGERVVGARVRGDR